MKILQSILTDKQKQQQSDTIDFFYRFCRFWQRNNWRSEFTFPEKTRQKTQNKTSAKNQKKREYRSHKLKPSLFILPIIYGLFTLNYLNKDKQWINSEPSQNNWFLTMAMPQHMLQWLFAHFQLRYYSHFIRQIWHLVNFRISKKNEKCNKRTPILWCFWHS